jgi:hypothetical protein
MANTSSRSLRYAIVALLIMMTASPVWAAGDCDPMPKAVGPITGAHPVAAPDAQPAANPTLPEQVELRHWIAVGVTNLDTLLKEAKCRNKSAIVYLNGHAIKDLPLSPGAVKDALYFRLERTNGDRAAWGDILGSPSFDTRLLNVTVGIDGEPPLSTATGGPVSLKLTVLAWPSVLAAGALFVALLIGFFLLMRHSNILRDATPPEDAVAIVNGKLDPSKAVTNRGTYSLAKLQAAWWFFIIIGAYLLIGIVTWDFYSSVSSTALILLGIGAGTVVGGTLIDTSKDTPETADAGAKRAAELKSRILLLDAAQEYCHLYARQLDVLDPPSASPRPLTPEEDIRLHALTNLYGPNMVQWLRGGFGVAYTTIADIFELQTLNQADEAQAVALTGGAARPAPVAQLVKLRAAYAGSIADLCQLKALRLAGVSAPAELANKLPTLPDFASLVPKVSEVTIEKNTAISRYRKLTNQSESWFIDILSDANGVSFHRFQLFSWTLILGGVFVGAAYLELIMPVFDTTLLGLLGLSAATYLGLKVPEPTVPPK